LYFSVWKKGLNGLPGVAVTEAGAAGLLLFSAPVDPRRGFEEADMDLWTTRLLSIVQRFLEGFPEPEDGCVGDKGAVPLFPATLADPVIPMLDWWPVRNDKEDPVRLVSFSTCRQKKGSIKIIQNTFLWIMVDFYAEDSTLIDFHLQESFFSNYHA